MADERNVTRDTRKSIASEYISKPEVAGLDQTIVHARMFNVGKYKITYLKNAVPNSLDQVWRANIALNNKTIATSCGDQVLRAESHWENKFYIYGECVSGIKLPAIAPNIRVQIPLNDMTWVSAVTEHKTALSYAICEAYLYAGAT